MKANLIERKESLETLLNIADGIMAQSQKEADRNPRCMVCRDYILIEVVATIPTSIKDTDNSVLVRRGTQNIFARCSCERADNSGFRNMPSIKTILETSSRILCKRCRSEIHIEDWIFLPARANFKRVDIVCAECIRTGRREFQEKYDELKAEYDMLCGKQKPLISAEEMAERFARIAGV